MSTRILAKADLRVLSSRANARALSGSTPTWPGLSPIAIVVIEAMVASFHRHKKVKPSIPVVTSPNTRVDRARVRDNGALGDFRECAVAIVSILKVFLIGPMGDDQIRKAVVVVIAPGNVDGFPKISRDPDNVGPGESAIAVIAVKKIAGVRTAAAISNEDIGPPVAVVIRRRCGI